MVLPDLMQAAFINNGELILQADTPRPKPSENEVLLKVLVAGICSTDLAIINGYAGFKGTPGHEFVGLVAELGSAVASAWQGRRVVAEINQWCGHCEYCTSEKYAHCTNREVIGIRASNGAFAEYLLVNVNTLVHVPDQLTDEQAVFIEPLAAAFRILEQIERIEEHKNILIIGAGKLGQLIARVLALTDNEISVSTKHVKQKHLLKDISVNCIDEREIISMGYDLVIETSGHISGFKRAIKACCSLGYIVLKSTYLPSTVDLSQVIIRELTLIGSRCGPFEKAIKAMEANLIDPRCLIEKIYPLSEIGNAIDFSQQKGTMKVLIKPGI